jgi:hypothetical protein
MIDFSAGEKARILTMSVGEDGKSVAMTFWREPTDFATLIGVGVERLLVNEFRELNIVDQVLLWDAAADPDEFRQSLGKLISGSGGDDVGAAFLPLIEAEIAFILSGKKIFVEIKPVSGASIMFLSEKVTLTRPSERDRYSRAIQ